MVGFPEEQFGGDKSVCKKLEKIRYDQGWVLLIKEAKNMGLSREEVRVILKEGKNNPQYTVQ